jgi:hypothetical protein
LVRRRCKGWRGPPSRTSGHALRLQELIVRAYRLASPLSDAG